MNAYWLSFPETGARALWLWSWQAAILLMCVWTGLKLFRVQSPALRHHIWLLGLLAVTFLPIAPKLLPATAPQRWQGQALHYIETLPRLGITPSPTASPSTGQPTSATSTPQRTWSFSAIVFVLWCIGASLMLARLLSGLGRIQRIRQTATPITAAELGCAEYLNDRVPLRLTEAIQSPLLHGVARPLILLPQDFGAWTSVEERRAMIEHELAHVRRRDHYTNVLLNLLHVIFYFHPLVRLACHHLRLEREIACDDCVINAGTDATIYAESILKAAERSLLHPLLAVSQQPAFLSNKQTLERRIEMIMKPDRTHLLTRQWHYLLTFAVLLAALSWTLLPPRLSSSIATAAASSTDEQTIVTQIRLAVRVLTDGNQTWVDPKLSHADFYDAEAENRRMLSMELTVLKAHGHKLLKVEADDFKTNVLGNHATVNFQSTFYFQRGFDGKEASYKERFIAHLTRDKERWVALRSSNDRQMFIDLVRVAADANMRKDASVFEQLLTDDYIGTHPDGAVTDKAQELAAVTQHNYHIQKYELDDIQVRAGETSAVMNFLGTLYLEPDAPASTLTVQYRYTVSFVKRQGAWKIMAIHMSQKS